MSAAVPAVSDAGVARALRDAVEAVNGHTTELRSRGYGVDILVEYPDDDGEKIMRVGTIEKTVKARL